jgi:DNA-binding response OmpR family regulator
MAFDLEDRLTHTPKPAAFTPPAAPKGQPVMRELQSSGDIRILILDDDPATCSVIQAALSNRDFVIDVVSDPSLVESALARPNHYHLLILDYVLPGLEPDNVFSWIRDSQPDANIVVVTGYPSVDSALNCLRARTYDYLTKPFQVDQLREIVFRCLESKGLLRMTEEALRESLGNAIRERRKALGLTLSNMSDRTNVSLGYLSQIELGKNSASIETLYRICLALGMKMSELFQAVQRN